MTNLTRLSKPVIESYEWQDRAACGRRGVETFFTPPGLRDEPKRLHEAQAVRICASCPVIESCRRHALQVREPYGVWGGLTVEERQALLRDGSA